MKVKLVKGDASDVLRAVLPVNTTSGQLAMPNRFVGRLGTGVEVKMPAGYCLCFALVPALAVKGLLATNAPGRVISGEVFVDVLNAGREIISVKEGDPLLNVWVEKIYGFSWEK